MQWRDDTTFPSIRPICKSSECLNDRLGFELGHRRYPLNVRFARKRTSIRALAMSHKAMSRHSPLTTFQIAPVIRPPIQAPLLHGWELNDAATLWEPQIASDAMSLDA